MTLMSLVERLHTPKPDLEQQLTDSLLVSHPLVQQMAQLLCDFEHARLQSPQMPLAELRLISSTTAARVEDYQRAALLAIRSSDPVWRQQARRFTEQRLFEHIYPMPSHDPKVLARQKTATGIHAREAIKLYVGYLDGSLSHTAVTPEGQEVNIQPRAER